MRHDKTRKNRRDNRNIAYLRGKLLERRERLLHELRSEVDAALEPSHNPSDDADLANNAIAQDTGYEIGAVEHQAVAEIDNALRRMESGRYGICEDCGRKIPAARLRALPFAYLCVECKAREEREGELADPFAFEWDPLDELSGGEAGDEEESGIPVHRGSRTY